MWTRLHRPGPALWGCGQQGDTHSHWLIQPQCHFQGPGSQWPDNTDTNTVWDPCAPREQGKLRGRGHRVSGWAAWHEGDHEPVLDHKGVIKASSGG